MADSFTPTINLTKPEVGSSRDTWGTKTNSNWDKVDAALAARSTTALTVSKDSGTGYAAMPAGTTAQRTGAPYGAMRFNSELNKVEVVANGPTWRQLEWALPLGTVLMYAYGVSGIPQGWFVCDGSNGTPDLRDRFIVSVGTTYGLGVTGGAPTITPTGWVDYHIMAEGELASHGHSQSVHGHGASQPAHAHINGSSIYGAGPNIQGGSTWGIGGVATDNRQPGVSVDPQVANINAAGSNWGHNHPLGMNPFDNRPPYVALYYIIKLY